MPRRFTRLGAVFTVLALGLFPMAKVTAADTLPIVSIAASDRTASEPGTNTGAFTITRTGDMTAALTVSYTVSGTATTGTDYSALFGSVVIPAAAATAAILVTPLDDLVVEPTETIIVTLVASSAYTIGTPSASTVRVRDNDGAAEHQGITGDERPGWGWGDQNHEHFGAPGQGCSADDPCTDDDDVRSSAGSAHEDNDAEDSRDREDRNNRGRGNGRGRH